jgi:hypothetical protein
MQITTSSAGASGKTHFIQVPPKITSPFPRTSDHLSAIVGQGSGSESMDATAARQGGEKGPLDHQSEGAK